jgi:hypothetical protein
MSGNGADNASTLRGFARVGIGKQFGTRVSAAALSA